MPSFDDLKPFIVLGFALGGVFAAAAMPMRANTAPKMFEVLRF